MPLIVVAFKLGQDWSPEQISQWLHGAYPEDTSMRLSHEAIYRFIYIAECKALTSCSKSCTESVDVSFDTA